MYTVGILYRGGRIVERKFHVYWIAKDTMRSLAHLSTRYPGTIINLWMR